MDNTTKPIGIYSEMINSYLLNLPREIYKIDIILNIVKAIFDNNHYNIDVYHIRPNEEGDHADVELIYNNAYLSLSLFKMIEQEFDQESSDFKDREDKNPRIKISINKISTSVSNIIEIGNYNIYWSFGYFIDPFFDYVVIWTSIASDKNKNGMWLFKRSNGEIKDPRIKELFD